MNSNMCDLNSLKSNPIFKMSLSSKELFHSNMLEWFGQDESLKDMFISLINSMAGEEILKKDSDYIVRREFHNLDFCVCTPSKLEEETNNRNTENQEEKDPGEILFVLENKFKSIPYKSQLDRYQIKVEEWNRKYYKKLCCQQKKRLKKELEEFKKNWKNNSSTKAFRKNNLADDDKKNFEKIKAQLIALNEQKNTSPTEPIFVLLTLCENFTEKEKIIKSNCWNIVTYNEYSKILKEKKCGDEFTKNVIYNYAEFIGIFASKLNQDLQRLENNKSDLDVLNKSPFFDIRCGDIWQKAVLHKIAQDLNLNNVDYDGSYKHILEDNNLDIIYVGVEIYHSQGLLSLKKIINNDCVLEVELQGGNICVGIGILRERNKWFVPTKPEKDDQLFQVWKNAVDIFLQPITAQINNPQYALKDHHAYYNKDNSGYFYKIIDKEFNQLQEVIDCIKYLIEINCSQIKIKKCLDLQTV